MRAAGLQIPIFPLGTVLFPAGLLPLKIFEPRYLQMTRDCLRENRVFGVCLIRGGFEVGVPAVPSEIGCTARIVDYTVPAPGRFTLVVRGETVFRLKHRQTRADGLLIGTVELCEPPDPTPMPETPIGIALGALLARLLQQDDLTLPLALEALPKRFDDAGWVANRLAERLPITPEQRLALLDQTEPLARLAAIDAELDRMQAARDRPPEDP